MTPIIGLCKSLAVVALVWSPFAGAVPSTNPRHNIREPVLSILEETAKPLNLPKTKWQITIYDNVQCFQPPNDPKALPQVKINDQTRSRTIRGHEANKCYTFNDDMPGTDCYQLRENGKVREACDKGKLTPLSIGVEEGSKCQWYTEPGCNGNMFVMPNDDQRRCIDTVGLNVKKEIRSFKGKSR